MAEDNTGNISSDSQSDEERKLEQIESVQVASYPWEPESDPMTRDYITRAREASDNLEYQEALNICEDAEAKGLKHSRLISNKAVALIGLKRYDDALDLLEKGLKEFPNDPGLHYNLASIYGQTRRSKDAKEEAARVLDLVKGIENEDIDERLSACISGSLRILHRLRDANRLLEWAVERFPDNENLRFQLTFNYAISTRHIKAFKQQKHLQGKRKRAANIAILIPLVFEIISVVIICGLAIWTLSVVSPKVNLYFICLFVGLLVVIAYAIVLLSRSTRVKRAHPVDRWAMPIE